MKFSNQYNLPSPVLRAIENDPYTSAGSDISTTSLINPPQIEALKKRYEDQITEDASERIWSLLGQATHVIAERAAGADVIPEKRYFAEAEGWKLSGQVDLIDGTTLIDYKVTSVWTYLYKSRLVEWAAQGNVNRWLYWKNTGAEITKLENILVLRDWSRRDAEKYSESKGYPPVQVVVQPLELWSLEKAESYIKARILLHQAARAAADENMPPCSDEERWLRNGKAARCADYCPVSTFCHQRIKDLKNAQ